MSDKEQITMKINNLIYRLNNQAMQRKQLLDQLWQEEENSHQMRTELLALIEQSERNKT